MQAIEAARWAVAGALTLVLALAAASDIIKRKIPNWTVLAVIGLFAVWAVVQGGAGLLSAAEAAGVAIVVSVALYAFGIVGAGDSKLFAATALFAGMSHLGHLALLTVLSGGVIALGMFAARPIRGLTMLQMKGKGDWGRGVPYGVAIALGCVVVVWGGLFNVLPQL